MLDAEIDAHIVIALALEVVFQVPLALNEQVIVDCTLLKNRNVSLELSSGDFRFDGFHFDDRPGNDIQAWRDAARRGIVIETGEIHFGGKPALALIFTLHSLDASASACVGYLPPPVDDGDTPFGGPDDD